MLARLLALVCLLYVSVSAVRAQALASGDVAVYLKTGDSHSGRVLDHMKSDLEALMRSVGVDMRWWNSQQEKSTSVDRLVVLELHGTCETPQAAAHNEPLPNESSLASSVVADGLVQPFSRLDCDALARFLAPALAGMTPEEADRSYGRAMARVAAHELYHVLSKKRVHAQTGVAKASFTPGDLLGAHLSFEEPDNSGATGGFAETSEK